MIDHGREGPALAVRITFEPGDLGDGARVGGIEGRGEPERHGKHRPVAVDDVGGEHHRDAEPRFLDRDALDAVDVLRRPLEGGHLEADALARQVLRGLVRPAGGVRAGHRALAEQHELVDLFLERHAREQRHVARVSGDGDIRATKSKGQAVSARANASASFTRSGADMNMSTPD